MAKQILGKVVPIAKGTYNSSTQYLILDIVEYNGSSYIAKQNVQGQAPTNTTYWQLLASQGDKPVYKVDYLTDAEMAEIVNDIITDSTNTFNQNVTAKTTAFNNNATDKTTAFNSNATSKTSDFNTNASLKTTAFNSNASDKQGDFNSNASSTKDDFDRNATAKTEAYDDNATSKVNAYNSNASDKTTAFNNNATAKTEAFNDNYDSKVELFDEHSEELQEQLDRYKTLENALPHANGEGAIITLNDTAKSPLTMDLEPTELSQASTPSPSSPQNIHVISGDNTVKIGNKNLCPVSTFEAVATKRIVGDYTTVKGIPIFAGETVTASFNVTTLASSDWRMQLVETSDSTVTNSADDLPNEIKREVKTCNQLQRYNISLTAQTDGYIYLRCVAYGTVLQNIQIEKNATETSYEIQKKTNAKLNLPVENLLNIQNGTYTAVGITAVATNGKIVLNGTSTNTAFIEITLNAPVNFTSDKSYTLSAFNPVAKSGTDDANLLRISDEGGVTVLQTPFNKINSYATKSNTNKSDLKLVIRIASGETLNNFEINPQLEVGTKSNSYSQYGTTPLEYCKIVNYKDRFFKNIPEDADYNATRELGKWYLKKNIYKVVLDGSENGWSISNNGTANWYYFLYNAKIKTALMQNNQYSSHYVNNDIINNNTKEGFMIVNSGNYIRIRYGGQDTVDNFKNWLSTHNVTFEYILATPEYILLNDTLQEQLETIYNKLLSYQEQTNISQENNDLPFNIKAKAVKDLNSLIEI